MVLRLGRRDGAVGLHRGRRGAGRLGWTLQALAVESSGPSCMVTSQKTFFSHLITPARGGSKRESAEPGVGETVLPSLLRIPERNGPVAHRSHGLAPRWRAASTIYQLPLLRTCTPSSVSLSSISARTGFPCSPRFPCLTHFHVHVHVCVCAHVTATAVFHPERDARGGARRYLI
jgi:hypothetical protein